MTYVQMNYCLVYFSRKCVLYRVIQYIPHTMLPLVPTNTMFFHDPISMPNSTHVFIATGQPVYFRSHSLCVKVEDIFTDTLCMYFWGGFTEIVMKYSTIGLYTYITPNSDAHKTRHIRV